VVVAARLSPEAENTSTVLEEVEAVVLSLHFAVHVPVRRLCNVCGIISGACRKLVPASRKQENAKKQEKNVFNHNMLSKTVADVDD